MADQATATIVLFPPRAGACSICGCPRSAHWSKGRKVGCRGAASLTPELVRTRFRRDLLRSIGVFTEDTLERSKRVVTRLSASVQGGGAESRESCARRHHHKVRDRLSAMTTAHSANDA